MDILLVSGRRMASPSVDFGALAARLAGELLAAGARVRWLGAAHQTRGPAASSGIELLPLHAATPPFRKVAAALADPEAERALTLTLRERLPDAVHVLGHGGRGNSVLLAWLADRLGAPAVVTADAREVLCHRGTLVDHEQRRCEVFDDPERCTRCCGAPFAGGLSRRQARLARALRWLGPFSPFPHALALANRLDAAVAGLQAATLVLAPSEEQAALLQQAGLPRRLLRVLPFERHTAAELLPLYRSLTAPSGGTGSMDAGARGGTVGG